MVVLKKLPSLRDEDSRKDAEVIRDSPAVGLCASRLCVSARDCEGPTLKFGSRWWSSLRCQIAKPWQGTRDHIGVDVCPFREVTGSRGLRTTTKNRLHPGCPGPDAKANTEPTIRMKGRKAHDYSITRFLSNATTKLNHSEITDSPKASEFRVNSKSMGTCGFSPIVDTQQTPLLPQSQILSVETSVWVTQCLLAGSFEQVN